MTNKISCLYDGNSSVLEDVEKIGDACEAYYRELYAPDDTQEVSFEEFEEIEPSFTTTDDMADFLQVEVTREEVRGVLADILMIRH